MTHAFESPASRVTNPGTRVAEDAIRSRGLPLDEQIQVMMGARFGHDFSRVRVHTDDVAAKSAEAVSARAYTVGNDIFFNAGQYDSASRSGRQLLAHELSHVVQNARGGAAGHEWDPNSSRERAAEQAATSFTTGSGRVTVTGTGGHGIARQANDRNGHAPAAPAPAPATGQQAPTAPSASATDAFEEWWKKIPGHEGTLADFERNPANKADTGGLTNLGITLGTFHQMHQAAGLPDTLPAFRAMTTAQAKLIARAIWRMSRADQLVNPGVAILVADWHWHRPGDFAVHIKKALATWGLNPAIGGNELDRFTIGMLNALPPDLVIDLLSDARADFYKSRPKLFGEFTTGLVNRVESRRQQASAFSKLPAVLDKRTASYSALMFMLTTQEVDQAQRADVTASILGRQDFDAADVETIAKSLEPSQLKVILDGTATPGSAASGAAIAEIVRKRLSDGYDEARKKKEWAEAAAYLNGLDEPEVKNRVGKLKPAEISRLHQAAIGDSRVGASSPVARLTEQH